MARLLVADGEPRPDASGDAPCGEAKVIQAPVCRKVRLTSGGAAGNFF